MLTDGSTADNGHLSLLGRGGHIAGSFGCFSVCICECARRFACVDSRLSVHCLRRLVPRLLLCRSTKLRMTSAGEEGNTPSKEAASQQDPSTAAPLPQVNKITKRR